MADDVVPEGSPCDAALTRAFRFLGKRWNGVLLATLMAGPMSFTQLRHSVDGISDSVLSDRLVELTEAGLVVRTVAEGPPVGVSYALSPQGRALTPALRELSSWAAVHLGEETCARTQGGRRPA